MRRRGPGAADASNAYVFGRRFSLSSYKRLGYCGNDGGQIGFIDLETFDAKAAKNVGDAVLEAYGFGRVRARGRDAGWENRAALRTVRKEFPYILFIGATDGGDVGATLYAHETAGRIDGLIVDNHFFFDPPI